MKIAKHIFAIVVALLLVTSMAFADFTAAPTVSVGVLDGTKITVGDDGFVFVIPATEKIMMSTMTVDVAALAKDGWTIEPVDGLYCTVEGAQGADSYKNNKIMPKINVSTDGYDCVGEALVQFKAVPGATSKIDGVTFKVTPIVTNMSKVVYKKAATYTLAKKADTPVVNKYNVTFTGYESENRTDVEENTDITLPAAPAVDKNKEFVGWNDGTTTYEAGAKYTVTGNVTFTAVINDITLPTPVVTKEGIISAEVEGKTYTDIFEGIYTLTPGKASLTKFGVKIPGKLNPADVREFATSGTFEGEGTFVYRVALFGVMDKADIVATPFAE